MISRVATKLDKSTNTIQAFSMRVVPWCGNPAAECIYQLTGQTPDKDQDCESNCPSPIFSMGRDRLNERQNRYFSKAKAGNIEKRSDIFCLDDCQIIILQDRG